MFGKSTVGLAALGPPYMKVPPMNPSQSTSPSRRNFLDLTVRTLGGAAAASLLTAGARTSFAAAATPHLSGPHFPGPHFPGKAKHVIYLHMVGGPSQMDLYDYKPKMDAMYDKDLPDSIRKGQRLTTMTSGQSRFPIAPSKYKFAQYGKCGMWVSELLPNTAKVVDEMCFIRSMNTDAINHEPAITFAQTGNQVSGKPCLGSWVSYAPGHAQPEPARLRGHGGQVDEHGADSGHIGQAVDERLSAGRTCRRGLPHDRRPDPLYQQSARRAWRCAPHDAGRHPLAERNGVSRAERSGHAHSD